MDHLTKDTIQTIERLHSAWIELEVAGEAQGLLAYCAEDIELRPPDGPSVYGRDAVLAYLDHFTLRYRYRFFASAFACLIVRGWREHIAMIFGARCCRPMRLAKGRCGSWLSGSM